MELSSGTLLIRVWRIIGVSFRRRLESLAGFRRVISSFHRERIRVWRDEEILSSSFGLVRDLIVVNLTFYGFCLLFNFYRIDYIFRIG